MTFSRALALCLIPLALGLTSGCKHKRHHQTFTNDVVTVETHGDFRWEADVDFYDAVEEYEWANPFVDAQVEFEAFDFYGEFTIEIFDHFDFLVYSRTFIGKDDYRYEFDLTEFGEPGVWFVRLISHDVDGLLNVDLY